MRTLLMSIKEYYVRFGLMIGFPIYVGHMFEFSIPYKRKKAAKLPVIKQLEDFDFSFQPSIDKKLISDVRRA